MKSTPDNHEALTPHLLQLVDPGTSTIPANACLAYTDGAWAPTDVKDHAFVFPSERLARRHAQQVLAATGQTWMPKACTGHSTVPQDGLHCRGCGCTELFACPTRCAWAEPDLCSSCQDPDPLPMWVVYAKPIDYPDRFIARKNVGGIPTEDIMVEVSLDNLRRRRPEGLVVIPRDASDNRVIVESWV